MNRTIVRLFYCFDPTNWICRYCKTGIGWNQCFTEGYYRIEIRASVEAMLTGINLSIKILPNPQTQKKYMMYCAKCNLPYYLMSLNALRIGFKRVKLKLDNKLIPPANFISWNSGTRLYQSSKNQFDCLRGEIPRNIKQLSWYYPAAFADNAVRVRQVDEETKSGTGRIWQWLRKDQWSQAFSLTEVFHEPPISQTIKTYTVAVLSIFSQRFWSYFVYYRNFLLSIRLKPLLWQVTMFTLAHSITLSLAMLGVFTFARKHSWTSDRAFYCLRWDWKYFFFKEIKPWRLVIVFAFGLLHGMGFASMLADFGMPENAFATALIFLILVLSWGN